MDPVSLVSQLVTTLWGLKEKYDQHNGNKDEIQRLLCFIQDMEQFVPALIERFRGNGASGMTLAALKDLEGTIIETTRILKKWSVNRSLFRVFNSAGRTQELERLHTTVMDSVQKAMGIVSTGTLADIKTEAQDISATCIKTLRHLEDSTAQASHPTSTSSIIIRQLQLPAQSSQPVTAQPQVLQHWNGECLMYSREREVQLELYFAVDNKIYGGGYDQVGKFTCRGKLRGSQVTWTEQRFDRDEIVEYVGEIGNSTIKGTCSRVMGYGAGSDLGCGTFHLKQVSKTNLKKSNPPCGVVPVGKPHLWTGYYKQYGCETKMSTHLLFTENFKIYGSGKDTIGRFTWLGRYHLDNGEVSVDISKKYEARHEVSYQGNIARQRNFKPAMQGSWRIVYDCNILGFRLFRLTLDEGVFRLEMEDCSH